MRRVGDGVAARVVIVVASGMLALPQALWPISLVGGGPRDLLSVNGRHYLLLYLAFGLLFAAWGTRRVRGTPPHDAHEK